jgi:hypothetical protein
MVRESLPDVIPPVIICEDKENVRDVGAHDPRIWLTTRESN